MKGKVDKKEKVTFYDKSQNALVGVLSIASHKTIVLLAHGFSSSKDTKARLMFEDALNQECFATLRFDFYGHGESAGKFEDITISKAVEGIYAAIDFVQQRGFTKIGLIGTSFGGMASIIAAAHCRDIAVLGLRSPVSDYLGKIIAQIAQYPVKEWKEKGFIYHTNHSGERKLLKYSFFEDAEKIHGYEEAATIIIPTLIVHGDADESVPVEQSQKTATLIKDCRLEILPGADHLFSTPYDLQKSITLFVDFMVEHLR